MWFFVKSGMNKVSFTVITDKAKTEAACVEENNDQHTVVARVTFRYLSVVCSTPDNSRFTWMRVNKVCPEYKFYRDISDLRLS